MLLHGDWLGLFTKNEHYKNARILIDIPNNLDHEWKIDIKKATATPSLNIRKDLIRLGKHTRLSAAKIYRYRGNQIMLDDSITSFDFKPMWKSLQQRDGGINYYINEEHPLVARLLDSDTIPVNEFKKILKMIGKTTPVEAIIQNYSDKPESLELRDQEKELDNGTLSLAKMMFDSLKQTGVATELAIKQILNIQPFNEYPQLIEHLK